MLLYYTLGKHIFSLTDFVIRNMGKGKHKFKGRKMAAEQLSFYVDHYQDNIKREIFTDNDTTLAPFLNNVLSRDLQQHVLSFISNMPIHTAWWEDSLLISESHYCNRQDDDFEIDIQYKKQEIRENKQCKGWYVESDVCTLIYSSPS